MRSRKAHPFFPFSGEIPEMIASVPPLDSGFILTDPLDPRYKFITGLKHRFGEFLHNASVSLRSQGEENTLDAVQMLVNHLPLGSVYDEWHTHLLICLGQVNPDLHDGIRGQP